MSPGNPGQTARKNAKALATEENPVSVRFVVGLEEGADGLADFSTEEYAKMLAGE